MYELPLVLTVKQAAEVLGIGKTKTYEIIRAGIIRTIRIGHQYRIPRDAILDYLSIKH